MKHKFITGLVFLLPLLGFSQGEFNKWYFPEQAGLDFNTNPPTPLTSSSMAFGASASASISDSLGNLLFYSEGELVFNRNHQMMPNGDLMLNGIWGINYSQPVFAVRQIETDPLYYLFCYNDTNYTQSGLPIPGLFYSVIDMRLNGGLGDVVSGMKNIPVLQGQALSDKMHGTRHYNNRDVWLVTRNRIAHQYVSYLINSSGISSAPVFSPSLIHDTSYAQRYGSMKISQDGKKLAAGYFNRVKNFTPNAAAEFCKFNSKTGVVTPLFCFRPIVGLDTLRPYDVEFSRDSRFLYMIAAKIIGLSTQYGLFQYDATRSDSLSFMQSEVFLGYTFGTGVHGLQLAPDGKIYGTRPWIDSLSVINYPNVQGISCGFQNNALGLNGQISLVGLPQFLQRYKAYIHSSGQCQGHPVTFSGDIWPPADTTRWNFGDPASGTANVSTQTTPAHLYATPGTYTVTLYVRHNDNRTDTTLKAITIHPTPSPDLGPDQTILQGDQATFDAGSCSGCTYQWANITLGNPNIGTGQTYSTGVAGVYMVSVTSQNGCVGRDTVQLTVIPVNPSSCTGYEYWFAAPAVTNHTVSPSPVSLSDLNSPISMFFTTDEGPATVTVDQPANPLFTPITCTVNNDSAEVVILTPFLEMIENKPADSLLNYGLRVSSDKRISASYEIQSPYNAATWSLWGKDALGYSFIVPAQHSFSNYPHCSPPARNSFEVVAMEDSTMVTVIPEKDIIGHVAHLPFSIMMNRGQTWSGRATSGDSTMHLGGTRVTSTRPIAVTVTDDAIFVPGYDELAFDVAGEQLIPKALAGKEFIAMAMSLPAAKTKILVYPYEDNTTIVFNDSLSIQTQIINQGESAEFFFTDVTNLVDHIAAYIHSDKPVSVLEFTGTRKEIFSSYLSFQASESILPPLECRGSKKATISSTPPGAPWHSWMVYAVAKRATNDAFTFDPTSMAFDVTTPVPGTGGIWGYGWHGIGNSDYYFRVKITNDEGRFFIPAYSYAITSTGTFSKFAYFTDVASLNLGVDRQICPGECLLLDAGYGWSNYLWSTGDTTSTIMASSAGTYWVSTIETGCQLSDTIVISYYPFTPVNLGPDRSICAGDSTLLNAGPGRSWYLWSTGATTQSIWAKTSGNYWIKTSGGYCDVYDTVAVTTIPPPLITTTPLAKTICTGENTNIALAATVTNTVFHWTASLGSGTITGFSADSGLVINQTLINNGTTTGVVTYHITPKIGDCAGVPVDYGVTVSIGNPVGVTISAAANNICAGTPVTFTATAINGGSSPSFQWKVNGLSAGTNSPTFTYTPAYGDQIFVICSSSIVNCISNNPATSNEIVMVVNPLLTAGVTISASANPICQGNPVTLTATPVNGGATPLYQWFVNGVNQFTGSPVYTYIPTNSDQIFVICNSSIVNCISNNPAISAPVTMVVNSSLPAGITIAASANPFCPGAMITFTATPLNGGTAPTFQWLVNGANQFTGSPVYQFAPQAGDSIRCIMISNLSCVTGNPASSAKIIMIGTLAPSVAFSACFDTVTNLNAKPFKLKGGLPIGGTYSGPGVNSSTGIFTPSVAGIGVKTINYAYINVYDCGASKSKSIVVQPNPPFTCGNNLVDPRDNKVYPTVQIGSQCWMASNLEFGITIDESIPQTDNCISERYIRHSSFANSSFYQWDELMQYQTAEGVQGLCPPGWHVPTSAEWDQLLTFLNGSGVAGGPMKDTVWVNGFHSLQQGFYYQNNTWAFESGIIAGSMYWTSTPSGSNRAVARGLNMQNPSVSKYGSLRGNAFGVRCLKDN